MTQELLQTLCDHAMGNYCVLCTMANELLTTAAIQEKLQLDEELYLECFAIKTSEGSRRLGQIFLLC